MQTFKPNFATRVATTLGIATLTAFSAVAPAQAEPTRVGQDVWSAYDSSNNEHVITVVRQDREGDYLVEVKAPGSNFVANYWIDCKKDIIVEAREGAQWEAIDHRKMQGWYSDVACRLN